MENEHFSVSRVTNWYIIIIVNSPGRSSIKFYTGKLCPGSNYLQIRYSFRIPFHSSLMVEGSSGLLQAFYPQGVLKKVLYGEALPRGPCPYLSTYHVWQNKYSFRIPFHPFWRLRGGVACYRHFIPRGYSRKFYTGKPCSKVHVLTFPHTIFDRKGTPLVFHPFWRLRGGVACYRHFKISSDNTRVNGKKDCLIKIKLARYFAVSFFSNKIVSTLRNL